MNPNTQAEFSTADSQYVKVSGNINELDANFGKTVNFQRSTRWQYYEESKEAEKFHRNETQHNQKGLIVKKIIIL